MSAHESIRASCPHLDMSLPITITSFFPFLSHSTVNIMCWRSALRFVMLALVFTESAHAATLAASPDPVQVCDGSGLAQVTISWNAADTDPPAVEVRVGSATGTLFAAGQATGSAVTGKWTTNGTIFYLVNPANKQVLAQSTAHLTTVGCPAPQPKTFWQRLFGK